MTKKAWTGEKLKLHRDSLAVTIFTQSTKPIDVINMLEADSVDYDDTKGKEFCFRCACISLCHCC